MKKISLSVFMCILLLLGIGGYVAYQQKLKDDELRKLKLLKDLETKRLAELQSEPTPTTKPIVNTGTWKQPVALNRTKEEADRVTVTETDTGQIIEVVKKKMVVEQNITDKSVPINKSIVQPLNQSNIGTIGDKPCKRYPRTSEDPSPPDDGTYTYGECPLPDGTSCCKQKDIDKYGCTDENSMWIKDGCRGLFVYKGRMGYCGSMQDIYYECDNLHGKPCRFSQETCPIDNFKKLSDGNVAGLVDPKENLVLVSGNKWWEKMQKKNPCNEEGAWGMDDYDRPTEMWTTNGCRGYFKLGTTEGFCRNFCWDDSDDCKKQYCPIGTTNDEAFWKRPDVEELDEFGHDTLNPDGEVIMKNWHEAKSGLRKTRIRRKKDVTGDITGDSIADWMNDDCEWEISNDGKKLHPIGCGGEFSWGYLKGECNKEEKQKSNCLINWDGESKTGIENDGQLVLMDFWKERV